MGSVACHRGGSKHQATRRGIGSLLITATRSRSDLSNTFFLCVHRDKKKNWGPRLMAKGKHSVVAAIVMPVEGAFQWQALTPIVLAEVY